MDALQTLKKNKFFKTSLLYNYPLKDITSFKIGGNAEAFFSPQTEQELSRGLLLLKKSGIRLSLIGGGSNLLVADTGIKGVVISLKYFNKIEIEEKDTDLFIRAGAGVLTDKLTEWAIENSISGFEDFGGLPGTIGGAAFMNARCYEKSISDILVSARTLEIKQNGEASFYSETTEYQFCSKDWDYKKSPFQANANGIMLNENRKLVLSCLFRAKYGDKLLIQERTEKRRIDRIQKGHFKAPSAGSTFKNNRLFDKPSGKIIEEAALKGFSIGGAQVAPWHGNFIINTGNASSRDVLQLIQHIQKTVFEKTGFFLEPEVIFAN